MKIYKHCFESALISMPNRTPPDPAIYLTANPDPDPDPDFAITPEVKVLHFFFPFFYFNFFLNTIF
jgi:hypothetical protein